MMKTRITLWVSILIFALTVSASAEQTRTPYLEAMGISHEESPRPADIQRELVLLSGQTRLTPSWPEAYRRLADAAIGIGRGDLGQKALQKYLTLTKINATAQLELVNLEAQGYQTSEGRRQYLTNRLQSNDLLPEVISDIYRQLGQIAWQNYERERAKKYVELAIKRVPQNLQARQLLRRIVLADSKAGAIQDLETQIGELQGRVMINPLDARASMELAILAGKAKLADMTESWRKHAEEIRTTVLADQSWPESVRIGLAESYLAGDEPEKAIGILNAVSQNTSTAPTSGPTVSYTGIHERIILGLAAKADGNQVLLTEQEAWFDRFSDIALSEPAASSERLILASMWYSLYSPKPDYAKAVNLARKAVETRRGDSMATITLAVALARSGEVVESSQLLKTVGESANPLVTLARVSLLTNQKQADKAKEVLSLGLKDTPFGPLRTVMLTTAEQLGFENPPEPDLAEVREQFEGFNQAFLKSPQEYGQLVDVGLNIRGQLTRGQIGDMTVTLANRGDIPLSIGPGSLIHPYVAIEIQPIPGSQRPIVHCTAITSRQLIEPGKEISVRAMLNEVKGWDSFIANRDDRVTQVVVRASVVASAGSESAELITLARSPEVNVQLPQISGKNADAMIHYLKGDVTRDSWQTARLAYWLLLAGDLSDRHTALVTGMVNQMKKTNPPETRAAFAWALRAGKADGRVFNAMAGQLGDDDWLVRLMSLDTLGQLQGQSARKLFEYYAIKDCDPLVRQLSTSYLMVKE